MIIKKIILSAISIVFLTIVILAVLFIFIQALIYQRSRAFIYSNIESIPDAQVALVLGASVTSKGELSDILNDRAQAAIELYGKGKVQNILVSGDYSSEHYDEVGSVKKFLADKKIPESDIYLDPSGYDTYDSIYRAKEVFEAKSIIVVSQDYHLPRAVYIGRSLGLPTYGFPTQTGRIFEKIRFFELRERFANIKAVYEVLLDIKPIVTGDKNVIGD
jgi:SanA protein